MWYCSFRVGIIRSWFSRDTTNTAFSVPSGAIPSAYSPEDLGRLVAQWKTILGGCGFRRVVFLHSNVYNKLNGSLIIDDSTLSLAAAESPSPFRGATR
jgi:hypothetical protein